MSPVRLLRWLLVASLTVALNALPAWAAYDSAAFHKNKPLSIERITPKGTDVSAGRQIVFKFNQPVVPLGRMERDAAEIPITITPALQCQWRWLNTSNLACQLGDETALKLATRYEVLVKPGIMTQAKQTLKEQYRHVFTTERPRAWDSRFQAWRAPGMPKIQVHFNQPVTRDSAAKHLYMQTPNGPRVAVTVELPPPDGEQEKPQSPTVSSIWTVSSKILLPLDTK
ncbi:MAG TPA: large extracellular alpha-helical protein, partial [Thioploca sp.]|nr:large extracellular alpha-helical protein [Thioploca sp.]